MFWAADIRRAAYNPETISMLSTVLERAIAALPHQQRTEERKARLASSILGAAARGERDPIRLYATALVVGPWEPAIGDAPTSAPLPGLPTLRMHACLGFNSHFKSFPERSYQAEPPILGGVTYDF
jgi:hypothetical protein